MKEVEATLRDCGTTSQGRSCPYWAQRLGTQASMAACWFGYAGSMMINPSRCEPEKREHPAYNVPPGYRPSGMIEYDEGAGSTSAPTRLPRRYGRPTDCGEQFHTMSSDEPDPKKYLALRTLAQAE